MFPLHPESIQEESLSCILQVHQLLIHKEDGIGSNFMRHVSSLKTTRCYFLDHPRVYLSITHFTTFWCSSKNESFQDFFFSPLMLLTHILIYATHPTLVQNFDDGTRCNGWIKWNNGKFSATNWIRFVWSFVNFINEFRIFCARASFKC